MPEQRFYDTQPTGENTQVDYRDPTDVEEIEEAIKFGVIDELTQQFALWIRTKMWRRHVRETIARMFEYSNVLYNKIKGIAEQTEKRQGQVEQRQTSLEIKFKEVLANSTEDSEVIQARNSDNYGKFAVLDDRLENIERLMMKFLPIGFDVMIPHQLGVQPQINVRTWEYGIGVLPLGIEEQGLFGGTASQSVPIQITHNDYNETTVSLPIEYQTAGILQKLDNLRYLLINEETKRSIIFELHI